jgi:molybdopterin synthase sulfur carrier subunit
LNRKVKLLYFARLRETLGMAGEEVDVPESVTNINQLMAWLAARGEPWQQEFDGCRPVRAAINQELAANTDVFKTNDEIAFFPPVTGG